MKMTPLRPSGVLELIAGPLARTDSLHHGLSWIPLSNIRATRLLIIRWSLVRVQPAPRNDVAGQSQFSCS